MPFTFRMLLIVGLTSIFSFSSCSLNKLTSDSTADALWAGKSAMEKEPDVQFAKEAFPASLVTMDTFLISSPENEEFLLMLAEGYFSYAFGFLEWDLEMAQMGGADEEDIEALAWRTQLHYMRARDYGFRLLDNEDVYRASIALDEKALKKALADLDEDDVPGLFWASYAWGSAINVAQSDTDMLAALSVVEMMLARSMELDDTFYYSGGHLFLAVFYAMQPEMFGGDLEKAKHHFDIVIERYGDANLFAPYLKARYFATAKQDIKMFDGLINRVLHAPVEKYPELRLNNEIARKRAKFWKKNFDELILVEEPNTSESTSETLPENAETKKPAEPTTQPEVVK